MVEWNHDDQATACSAGRESVGVDNKEYECDGYSSDSSTSTVEDDDNLTTDGVHSKSVATLNNNDNTGFGNIAVTNSTDIHIGNKTFYQGPVTIKQIVYASGKDTQCGLEDGLSQVNGASTDGAHTIYLGNDDCPRENDIPLSKNNKDIHAGKRGLLNLCLGRASETSGCRVWSVALSITVLMTLITIMLVMVTRMPTTTTTSTEYRRTGEETFNQPNTKYNVTLSGKLRIITRQEWLAQPALEPLDLLKHPTSLVIISHTATEGCSSQGQCTFSVRYMQTFHIESKGWADIAYNFLIGGDGYVYTGRGWDSVGAHSYGYNVCSIGISFIGTYIKDHPTESQFLAAKLLIEQGVKSGKLSPDYQLVGHRQVSATESPGQALFDVLKTDPHWVQKPNTCAKVT